MDTDYDTYLIIGGWTLWDPIDQICHASRVNAYIYIYNTTDTDGYDKYLYPITGDASFINYYHEL